jgi:LacI family transcriptional regulator
MREVANLVGVSVQTISAVINDKPGITEETRERVRIAIAELGYHPFTVARSLRTRQTKTIALIVSDIANPSFATMASAAEDYARSYGYSLVVYNTHDKVEREASYIHTATMRWVDGVLLVAAQDQLTSLDRLREVGIPSVVIDRLPEGYSGPSVTLNNFKAGFIAAQHLISLGHSRIAHISGPLRLRLARERLEGFKEAMLNQGLSAEMVFPGDDWSCNVGYHAMQAILSKAWLPTAIFAANDRMAIGAMQAAHKAGYHIPNDLSIVGLDDIELAAYQIPPLTTVRQSFTEIATQGVKTLLAILEDEIPQTTSIVLEPTLIIRQSTAPRGANRINQTES